ncbi:MAG: hypothetical protein JNK69_05890 [Saprospiraceae bacterium]|nr:hypothetical protein [Candidatus Vicinibacter proximus]MBL7822918.1 hypothetical protein [Saprospiraceae bacterium]
MKYYFILLILLFEVISGFSQSTYSLNAINIGMIRNSDSGDIRTDGQVYFRLKRGTNYKYFVEGVDFTKYSLIVNNKDTVLLGKNSNNFTFPALPGFTAQDLATLIKEFGLKIVSPVDNRESSTRESLALIEKEVPNPCKPSKCDDKVGRKIDTFLSLYGRVRGSTLEDLAELNMKMISWMEQVTKAKYLLNSSSELSSRVDSIFYNFITKVRQRRLDLYGLLDSVNLYKCQPCIVSECVKGKDTLLRSNINVLAKQLDELGKFVNLDSLAKYMDMEQLARNSRPESYYSLPQYFNGEAKEIHIDLVPREPFYGPKYSTLIRIEEKGKPYFGYSSGLFKSLLENHNFTSIQDTIQKMTYLTQEGNSSLFGINALVHIGWYINQSDVSFHLGLGPTLSLAKPINPGLFIGGGLGIGRKDKLMINLGLHTSIIRQKSNIFEFDPVINKYKFDGITEEVYVSKVRTNLAFSIGYLFY